MVIYLTTEAVIKKMFDFQKYQNNQKLKAIIDNTIDKIEFSRELSDNEVELFAAGDPYAGHISLTEKKDD